jgi:hypothetical protein
LDPLQWIQRGVPHSHWNGAMFEEEQSAAVWLSKRD